jgi:hypothetical protein
MVKSFGRWSRVRGCKAIIRWPIHRPLARNIREQLGPLMDYSYQRPLVLTRYPNGGTWSTTMVADRRWVEERFCIVGSEEPRLPWKVPTNEIPADD